MATNNMHNLTTLIKRLEAATSRLEDMATTTPGAPSTSTASDTSVLPRSSSLAPSQAASAPPQAPTPTPVPAVVEAFDSLINEEVGKFESLSKKIGGVVAEQGAALAKAFSAERKFILVTTKAKKPDVQTQSYMQTVKELQEAMSTVDGIKVADRSSPFTNHLATVAEGTPMLMWVVLDAKPADHVKDMMDVAQYHANRVLKDYKEKEPVHKEWVQAYSAVGKALIAYIKQHYPMGITWNNKDDIDAAQAMRQVESGDTAVKVPSAGGAPPPPPPPLPTFDAPPPPPMLAGGVPSNKSNTADMGAVLDQISRGTDVTAHLKKVDPSQQTHKNPSLRGNSTVPARSDSLNSTSSGTTATGRGKSPVPHRKPESMRTKKPPRKTLESNKWLVENYDNPGEMVEIEASIQHSILITKCNKTTVRVYGKANAISVDSSSSVSLLIDSLVSAVDVIKTPRFEMQVIGTLPTVMLDQVDQARIILSPESLGTEIFTSKCTAVNVEVPGKTEEDDYTECPVPEQIKTVIRNGVAVSEIVEHAG